MKKYPFLQSKVGKCLFVLYFIAMMFLARETMLSLYLLGFVRAQMIFLGLTAAMAVGFLYMNRSRLKELTTDSRTVFALVCAAIFLIPMLIKRDWQLMYFSMLMGVYIGIFFSFFTDIREVSRIYLLILTPLALFSIIATYLLRIPADRGVLVPPIFYNAFQASFYNYFFANVSIWFVKNRNFGIFREPGVYQYFLMLGLYLNHYRAGWEKQRTMWIITGILSVTMLSTFATGGVIGLGLFAVVVFFDRKWHRTRKGRTLAIGSVLFVFVALFISALRRGPLITEVYFMLIKFVNGSDSITDRVGSLVENTRMFLHSPLWGGRIDDALHAVMNNTSSSTLLFAVLGIAGGLMNMVGWFALVWTKKCAVWVNLAMLLILAMTFNTQNFIAAPLFWIFPIMAIVERGLPLMEKEQH